MKWIYVITCSVMVALTAISCDRKNYVADDVLCTASPTNDTVILDDHAPTPIFAVCKENMFATITQVNDSRCPDSVDCVGAGKLNVVLQMDTLFSVALEPHKIIDTASNGKYYSLQLVDVFPHPAAHPVDTGKQPRVVVIIQRH